MTSDPNFTPPSSTLKSPQVIAAIIGGTVTLIVAILGFMSNVNNNSAQATAVIIITATLPPTEIAAIIATPTEQAPTATILVPTETASAAATDLPPTPTIMLPTTAAEPPPTDVPPPANLLVMWDSVSFTAINLSSAVLSLEGVRFSSSVGQWNAREWGPSLHNSLPPQDCLRLRDASAGQRNPPTECNDLYGLILVGAPALFWRAADSFEVLRNGQRIAICPTEAGRCEFFVG